jgi:hypothetical protein
MLERARVERHFTVSMVSELHGIWTKWWCMQLLGIRTSMVEENIQCKYSTVQCGHQCVLELGQKCVVVFSQQLNLYENI